MENELYLPGFADPREPPYLLRDDAERVVGLLRRAADLIAAGARTSAEHQIAVRFMTRDEVETWAVTLIENEEAATPNEFRREDYEIAIAWLTGERVRRAIEIRTRAIQAKSDQARAEFVGAAREAFERVRVGDWTASEGVLAVLEALTGGPSSTESGADGFNSRD